MTLYRRSKPAFIILLCLILVSSVMAITEKKGTITLKDGTVFEDVAYKANYTYRVVKFKFNDLEQNISFTDIQSIVDQDGNNITIRELNRKEDQLKENWKSSDDKVFREARKKPWGAAIGFHANYSVPLGDYYEGIDPGIGFGGDFNIAFTPNLSGKIIVSKSGMKVSDQFYFYSYDPMITILSQDMSIRSLRILLAAQFNHQVISNGKHKGNWYFYTGLGLLSEKITADLTVQDNYTSSTYTTGDEISDSYFLMAFGGGYQALLSPRIALDIGTNFDMITIASNGYGSTQYAYIFDLKIGLTAFMGGDK